MNQNLVRVTILGTLLLTIFSSSFAQKGYDLKFKVKGLKNDTVRLAYHYGDKQYIKDTAVVNDKGIIQFSGNKPLPPGIYLFAPVGEGYFEFIVSKEEQKFTIETQAPKMNDNLKAMGSKENEVFFAYQKFMNNLYTEFGKLQQKANDKSASQEERDEAKAKLAKMDRKSLDEKANEYKAKIFEDNAGLLFTKILKIMESVKLPDMAERKDTSDLWEFYYTRAHYFDNVDFNEPGILRTPVLHQRLKTYLENMVVPHPDSAIAASETVIQKAKVNEECYKYILITVFNYWMDKKYMCFDKVYIHFADKYYLAGQTPWADTSFTNKMKERVPKMRGNICDTIAQELLLTDTARQFVSLHQQKNEHIVMFFWDPDCGHCKKTTPKLKKWYEHVKAQGKDVEVFGIVITQKEKPWKKYIKEQKLEWINVMDYYGRSNFRFHYDIYSTPVIYLLDKDKKIKAKRIDVPTLEKIMNDIWEQPDAPSIFTDKEKKEQREMQKNLEKDAP